jgi:predicted patatin/cPLA2 family phospholipase
VTSPTDTCLPEYVPGDPEVLRALLRRRDSGSMPGARSDSYRIALVVSGGGMRGAYPGGMAHALEEAGLRHAFDEAYGTSAGAYVGAAFLTGQAWRVADIFGDHMTRKEFIDFRRLGTKRPVVCLDYLMDHVFDVAHEVPWEELRDSAAPLRVIATGADDLRPQMLHGFESVAEWKLALRATASIPYFAGPPTELAGRHWVDGSASEPIPVIRALREGATHVLVLSSRTRDELKPPGPERRNPFWARSLDQLVPGLGGMATGVRHYATSLELVSEASHPGRGDAHLLAITPSESSGISGLSTHAL